VVVPPGASIQAAIDGAADGGVIRLEAGIYDNLTARRDARMVLSPVYALPRVAAAT